MLTLRPYLGRSSDATLLRSGAMRNSVSVDVYKHLSFRIIFHKHHSSMSEGFLVAHCTASRLKKRGQQDNPGDLCLSKQFRLRCKRGRLIISLAGSNDGFPVNSGPYSKFDDDWEETRTKLNSSFQVGDSEVNSVQALHEAARKFQLAMEQQGSLMKGGWLAKSWLGVDQNSWIKPLAYQAAVHALLQAALEIASQGEGRDRDAHIFVQRSILRQFTPLEESINQQLSARSPGAEEWFWSQQHPIAVASFVEMLECDSRFTAATSIGWEGASVCPSKASDVSLVTLAISNTAALMKLGPAKLSCPPFLSTLTEEVGRLMNMLAEFIPIDQVYNFTSGVGLRHEFLSYFGPRAASYRDNNEIGGEEGAFWVDLVQQLLRGAIIRERIRTKLTSYDSIEVLERDLAVFGFFAALGRRTRLFLSAKNIGDSDESLAGLLRYLIGGSIHFYPQLASLSTYQLYIEVVCEEMDWLPLYPTVPAMSSHAGQGNGRSSQTLQLAKREAISIALDNCSRWVGDFMKYSTWIQQPAGARAATFLLNSRTRFEVCLEAYPPVGQQVIANRRIIDIEDAELQGAQSQLLYQDYWERVDNAKQGSKRTDEIDSNGNLGMNEFDVERKSFEVLKRPNDQQAENEGIQKMEQQRALFDKELQGVDEAVSRLECLLKEPEMGPGKQHITAACTNLEKIRELKKEVETLEASLRKKAASVLQAQEDSTVQFHSRQKSIAMKSDLCEAEECDGQRGKNRTLNVWSKAQGIEKFLPFLSSRKTRSDMNGMPDLINTDVDAFEQAATVALQEASTVSKEIQRFELLRQEFMDLEKRIQECAGEHSSERETVCQSNEGDIDSGSLTRTNEMDNEVCTSGDLFSKSLEKIKDTSTDVWRGTQLLATDVAAAMVLFKRGASGEELTEREKKLLKRTLTDLASVIPIGFLMLLPVTAVGHAAILAAIQRYAPALIPSAYARERLDLMRQLEQVRQMEAEEDCDEKALPIPPLARKRGVKSSD